MNNMPNPASFDRVFPRRDTSHGDHSLPETGASRHCLVVTTFPDRHAKFARRIEGTFEQIVARLALRTPCEFPAKDAMPMLSFAEFGGTPTERGSLRHNGNVLCLYGVIGDYDGGRATIDDACRRLQALGIRAALYTSASHTPGAPRWRILAPLSKSIRAEEYPAMVARLNAIFDRTLDPTSCKPAQGFYYGRVAGSPYTYLETNGTRFLDEIGGEPDPTPSGLTPGMPRRDSGAALEAVSDKTMAEIEGAVMALPESFWGDYALWMDVALALKSLVPAGQGARAVELWHKFSAQGDCYDQAEAQRKWDSAQPSDITYRSIFKWAREAGWPGPDPAPRRRFMIVPAGEYAAGAPLRWIVKGVLPKAGLGVIFGASGSGKSFMVMDMLASIARGEPWRGHRVTKACVVYVAAEGAAGLRLRLQALARHREIAVSDLGLGVIADAPNLLSDDDAQGLVDALCTYDADLIVIDTLAQAMPGGDENSSKDMGALLERARLIHDHTGAMVLLIHHAGKDAAKGARGWSGLRAAADFEAEVSRDGENRVLKLTKLKDGNDGISFGFNLMQVELGQDEDGDPLSSCIVEHIEFAHTARKAPSGKWQGPVYKVATELTRDGKVPAARIIERVVSLVPHEPGTRDRRAESAKRALEELCLIGRLKADGDMIGHEY